MCGWNRQSCLYFLLGYQGRPGVQQSTTTSFREEKTVPEPAQEGEARQGLRLLAFCPDNFSSNSCTCLTSREMCWSMSLFCSRSWCTRAWASSRAAASAASWSFSKWTCGEGGQRRQRGDRAERRKGCERKHESLVDGQGQTRLPRSIQDGEDLSPQNGHLGL